LDAPCFLISFSSKFFGARFLSVGGSMFFGGKNHGANAPREQILGFFGGKNTALFALLEVAVPKGGETAGGKDADWQETVSNNSRSADQNKKVRSDKIKNQPPWYRFCAECRMNLSGPATSVVTRTDYSVGPWDYSACATRHLMA
jgi:hypothetical protein